MKDDLDEMVVAVRADTGAFRGEIAALRGELEGSLGAGADAAGRAIERALTRAVMTGKLGFEDLKRLALSVMNEIARAAIANGIAALGGGQREATTDGAAPISGYGPRPAAALGTLAEPLAAGSADLFDDANAVIVDLFNPSMSLESVDDLSVFGGANRAMLGGELIQFGVAEWIAARRWRLSRLLRGRGGTETAAHAAGIPFVLLDDPALLSVPGELARLAEAGGAELQWAPRGTSDITGVPVASAGLALRPLAPARGRLRPDGAGGLLAGWTRRSRADSGWRDGGDLPLGEAREAWRIEIVPPVPGAGPWETADAALAIDAATVAAMPAGRSLQIRQVGDFALSPPLFIALS